MRRYSMRDDQWERIQDLLPGRVGHVGVTAKDNRLFVEAVLYRYRTGVPWRDLPGRFGCGVKVHTRFSRWAKAGVWERVFQRVAADADNEYAMIDSTIVRAHQHAAGAPKKLGQTRRSGAARAGFQPRSTRWWMRSEIRLAFISPAVRSTIWPERMPFCPGWKRMPSLPTRPSMPTSGCSSLWPKPARRPSSHLEKPARRRAPLTKTSTRPGT